jgi:uncharacterized damage-inducible protein DinB
MNERSIEITNCTEEVRAMTTLLANFFRYHLWANLRILDACAHLSDTQLDICVPGTFGSVRKTLVHIVAAEEGYVRIFMGKAPTRSLREDDPFPGFDELRRRAELCGESLLAIVEQFDPERVFHLSDEGQFYDVPAILVLIQAINHATDHHSQIATMLSQQGITLPELNSWA